MGWKTPQRTVVLLDNDENQHVTIFPSLSVEVVILVEIEIPSFRTVAYDDEENQMAL